MSVLVVGAGPTGLASACGLLAAGVHVRIIDAASGPATTSRALGLQPRGIEVLDRLGALGELPARGVRVDCVVVHVDGREITRLRIGGVTRLVTRPGVTMSQAEVEGQLRARLAELGGHVEWGTELTSLAQPEDWIVGCDGAHSRVRRLAGIGFPGVPLIERFLLADIRAELPLDRHAVATWLRGEQMFALFPLPDGRWRILTPDPGDTAEPDREALLLRLLTEHTGLPAERVDAVEWMSAFRIHRRLAGTYRSGRVLLAGDAAHIHSPFGGQGMNTGLGDAENLAWKLALVETGRADAALLDTYSAERRPVATEVLGSTSGMTRLMLGRTALGRVMRDHLVVPLMNRAVVQRRIAEASSQLRVSYRRGPLGSAYPWHGPRPGDRLADLPLAGMRGRWVLRGADPAAVRLAHAALGPDRVLALTGDGPAVLVRPDGHLACPGDSASMARWFGRAGIHTPAPAVL